MNDPRRPGRPPQETYPSFEERAYGGAQRPPPLRAHPRHDGHHRPRRKKRSGLFSVILVMLLGVVAVASGALVFLVTNPPTQLIRAQLIDQVKARTGRTLTIAGPTSFTVIPSLGLSMKDVTLSPPPGMDGAPFATMVGLDVSVRLLPLLRREVSIDYLVLQQPVIDLRVDSKGAKSWDFASMTAKSATPVRVAQAGGTRSDAPGGLPRDAQDFLNNASDERNQPSAQELAALRQLQLGDVRIVNGTIRYSDAKTQARQQVDAVNVRLDLDHIAAPLGARGDVKWRSEKIDFTAKLTSLEQVLKTSPAKLELDLQSRRVSGRYAGTVKLGDAIAAKGDVALNSPSVRQLASWLGSPLPDAPGYGPMQLKGQLDANGNTTKLSSAVVSLDNQDATGTVTVTTGRARPQVTADLKISQLDLNNYMDGGPPPRNAAPRQPKAAKDQSGSGGKPQSIEDLLQESGVRVKGYAQRAGWSGDKIDATALGAADVDANLTIGQLFVRNMKIGRSDLVVKLKNKVLKTTLKDAALYGGRGNGFVSVDATAGSSVGIGANLNLTGVEALDLLKDAAQQDWLAGKGSVKLAVAGQGTSQQQIMNNLNGDADLAFNDGAIVGINIPGLVRGISQGNLSSLASSPSAKTDFSSMTATWKIASGVANNSDLSLLSPLMRVTGAGRVMLGQQQVDYTLQPKLVASLQGQGGEADDGGLVIPVRVHGPWASPQITPDVGGILADPNKALDAVEKIGKQFKGKNAKEILDGLLGDGGSEGNASEDGSGETSPAEDLLNRFLR